MTQLRARRAKGFTSMFCQSCSEGSWRHEPKASNSHLGGLDDQGEGLTSTSQAPFKAIFT